MLEDLKYDSNGLITAVVQSSHSGRVLMVAWMSKESLQQSLETGETVFFSRSRNELWHKGATSGNVQTISKIEVDCDRDSLLITVNEAGVACHTGSESCFDSALLYESNPE
jgi:phosphoribosyl-AMP cyclohydrolase